MVVSMDRRMTSHAISAVQGVLVDHGLGVQHGEVLQNSNRLTVRFEPARVIARIAMAATRSVAAREVEVVRQLEQLAAPVAPLDQRFSPTVHDAGEFIVTLWDVCDPVPPAAVGPREYADSLARLHAGLRQVDGADEWPVHFTDRVEEALRLVADPVDAPSVLDESDRQLVASILRSGTAADRSGQQLLHGEPHSGNLMRTELGLVFFDLETCCRGPVEFDIAHGIGADDAPPLEAAKRYGGADLEILQGYWRISLALAIAWRYAPGDDLPNGPARARQWVGALRSNGPLSR